MSQASGGHEPLLKVSLFTHSYVMGHEIYVKPFWHNLSVLCMQFRGKFSRKTAVLYNQIKMSQFSAHAMLHNPNGFEWGLYGSIRKLMKTLLSSWEKLHIAWVQTTSFLLHAKKSCVCVCPLKNLLNSEPHNGIEISMPVIFVFRRLRDCLGLYET